MKKKVLVVDDDLRIRELLRMYLENADYAVIEADNGVDALLSLQQTQPDLVILDVMMPILDGLETCRQIRRLAPTPIILLTAKVDDEDKLSGFETGADDYVTKPFSPSEVVARVQAILRRTAPFESITRIPQEPTKPTLSYGRLSIDDVARTVKIDGEEIDLTAKEFDLLYTLAAHPGRIHAREALLSALWGYEAASDTRTVDVHMQRLRNKLHNGRCPEWNIATVWGVGYRFDTGKKSEEKS